MLDCEPCKPPTEPPLPLLLPLFRVPPLPLLRPLLLATDRSLSAPDGVGEDNSEEKESRLLWDEIDLDVVVDRDVLDRSELDSAEGGACFRLPPPMTELKDGDVLGDANGEGIDASTDDKEGGGAPVDEEEFLPPVGAAEFDVDIDDAAAGGGGAPTFLLACCNSGEGRRSNTVSCWYWWYPATSG